LEAVYMIKSLQTPFITIVTALNNSLGAIMCQL